MFEQKRLGDNGTSAATSKESGDRGDEMDEQDGQVAHLAIVPISTSVTRLGTRWDLCDKSEIRHRHVPPEFIPTIGEAASASRRPSSQEKQRAHKAVVPDAAPGGCRPAVARHTPPACPPATSIKAQASREQLR